MLSGGLVTSSLGTRYSIPERQKSKAASLPVISPRLHAIEVALQHLISRTKRQPWLPLVRDSNHLSSFPAAMHNSCWLCSASQSGDVCSHQILAESSSSWDLPNISCSGISRFHRVWPLEAYILGMCNSSFPPLCLHRAANLTWCPWLRSGVDLRKEHTKNSTAFPRAGLEGSITSTNTGQRPREIRRKSSEESDHQCREFFFWWKGMLLFAR